jgi:hypothetical protein
VEPARSTWTDARLDDFRRGVDERFDRVDFELRSIRSELNAVRVELGGQIGALQRTLLQVGGAQVVTLIAALATVIVTGR